MPEGGYDRLLCNLSTTWLLWQVPLQVGECQWGRSALHPSTNICRYLWPVLSQVPLHYNTFPCFVTFPHLRTLVCISVPAPQKVAIFLICSGGGDGRRRQRRTNTTLQNHLSKKTFAKEAFARKIVVSREKTEADAKASIPLYKCKPGL